jgi:hypothetical protein
LAAGVNSSFIDLPSFMLMFFKVKVDRESCLLLQFQALRLDMAFSWIWWGQVDLLEDKEEISRHAKDW